MFTSDRDFARDLCMDAAIYFDPLDPENILETVTNAADNPKLIEQVFRQIKSVKKARISWKKSVFSMKLAIDRLTVNERAKDDLQ
jgi:hypothetical protein